MFHKFDTGTSSDHFLGNCLFISDEYRTPNMVFFVFCQCSWTSSYMAQLKDTKRTHK